jgi:hypothetical protein
VVSKQQLPEVPVRFYRSAAGREIVLGWLRALDKEDRRVIGLDLMRVQFGWPIGMPLVRRLKEGLWECGPIFQARGLRACSCAFMKSSWSCCMDLSRRPRRRRPLIWRSRGGE